MSSTLETLLEPESEYSLPQLESVWSMVDGLCLMTEEEGLDLKILVMLMVEEAAAAAVAVLLLLLAVVGAEEELEDGPWPARSMHLVII